MLEPQDSIERLAAYVLAERAAQPCLVGYSLCEAAAGDGVTLRCALHDAHSGADEHLEGHGTDLVDALFGGLLGLWGAAHPSLRTISLASFEARAAPPRRRRGAVRPGHTDVTLRLANADGLESQFTAVDSSLTRACIAAVLRGTTFFVNSERAFVAVWGALEHARGVGRADSVARYTEQLSVLVQATSYTATLDQLRAPAPPAAGATGAPGAAPALGTPPRNAF